MVEVLSPSNEDVDRTEKFREYARLGVGQYWIVDFANRRIEQRIGDAGEIVPTLPSAHFDRVVHDPPTLALAGELYSLQFYRELFRVTRAGGRLFHYTGAPGRRNRGRDLPASVAQRLREAGFASVRPRPETQCCTGLSHRTGSRASASTCAAAAIRRACSRASTCSRS